MLNKISACKAFKIEISLAGPKYSWVLVVTKGQIPDDGGWVAGQMVEAMFHGFEVFVPCGIEVAYVTIIWIIFID